jgi:hypothetical protein
MPSGDALKWRSLVDVQISAATWTNSVTMSEWLQKYWKHVWERLASRVGVHVSHWVYWAETVADPASSLPPIGSTQMFSPMQLN